MKKLVILRGLPASGKSTWALDYVRKHPRTWIRLNMDDIRHMMGQYWVEGREPLVRSLFDVIVHECLVNETYNIVIDNTNLAKSKIDEKVDNANYHGYKVYEKDFDVSPKECIRRDDERIEPVGKKVIMDMYNYYIRTNGRIVPVLPIFKE